MQQASIYTHSIHILPSYITHSFNKLSACHGLAWSWAQLCLQEAHFLLGSQSTNKTKSVCKQAGVMRWGPKFKGLSWRHDRETWLLKGLGNAP